MHRILVTGGAGFIGSHVADALAARGHDVTVLDDLSGGCRANVPPAAAFVEGSITDHARIDALCLERRFDYIYHLAAYAAEGLSHFIRRFNYTNNVIGSVNLLNAAVNTGVRGIVFTSSIAVYGSTPPPMSEDAIPEPEDPYGIAKYAVERDLRACREMFGLDFIIFRPHNVYGPRQNIADRYRNVVGIFMNQILAGTPMTIFGDGQQTRAFTYIDDVAPVLAEAIEHPDAWGRVFNIGADRPVSLNDLSREVARAMGVAADVRHLDARHEAVHAHATHERLAQVFGPRRQTTLEDGLTAMARWVREQGARASVPFRAIEVQRNLPPSWREA